MLCSLFSSYSVHKLVGSGDHTDMLQVKRPQFISLPQKENIGNKKPHSNQNNIEHKPQKGKEDFHSLR